MSDENDDNLRHFSKILKEEDIQKLVNQDEDQLFAELESKDPVKQLQHFRNIKLYLDKMIGNEWLLLYIRKEDGVPVYVPNQNLGIKDQVFLSRLAENVAFQMIALEGELDD